MVIEDDRPWGEKAYNCNWITIKIKKKKRWQTSGARHTMQYTDHVVREMDTWNIYDQY